ncbi:MAG: helix-turn-helix transcriptional regulator [Candidatus Devosia phytovorans]|uniref:Helix-turn-helix transcriptional regulator n=1 Tax=Candidatus Devosia phytovorans TaxID=3121372 RepID=A0AAJ5VXH2_9HYPH|nr:helix-turn-helix transcriptional regulator [Devosia sp.]WEK05224.1 MAG: helix-turn-helix transcriptional regulator [Devosia sp.]
MTLLHPEADQITLPNVLAALGDDMRLAIIGCLARSDQVEGLVCGQLTGLTSKTNLTYHVAKLREAGVVKVQPEGTKRRVTLRRDDLDARFPGFLDTIIAAAVDLPQVETTLRQLHEQTDRS